MKKSNLFLLKIVAFCLLLKCFIPTLSAQNKSDEIDKLVSKYHEYEQFNGSVLVSENGKVIYKKGFGMANMEWDILNQSNTKHRLGSVTKQFTAMLTLQLAEKGKIKLDVPITTYLPDYPKTNGDQITIHQLLCHTSGIPNYTSFPDFFKKDSKNFYTPEEFVKKFADLPLEFKPGEKFAYSNSGYFVLGYIIEKVTGKTYEQNLQDQIFTPLNMVNTGFDHHETILKNRATGYEKSGKGFKNADYLDMSIPFSAGSLYATVEDLFLWDQALYTEKLLSAKYLEIMFKPYIAAGPGFYAYGWGVADVPLGKTKDKLHVVEHTGGINGFNTIISRIPADKNLIVLLNNTGGAPLNQMSASIRNILYAQPYEMPKKSLAKALQSAITEHGIEKGLLNFEKLRKDSSYDFNENEINSAGYYFLQSGNVKEAIAIFKINVENFPKSGNAYDSLGEAYLKDGDKKSAVLNYKKSVALDPENENGKKVLSEISK